jgi:cellulose synthase/poly-beta-1,6-N-acetylglucosamine synthase-like glycosyltransferase
MPVAAIILALSAAVIFYILIGYPILLRFAPLKAPAPAKDLRHVEKVSLILAVHNGAAHIREKIESILALDYPKEMLEAIVVSDASWDDTDSIVREYADRGIQLVVAPRGGKAAALNWGMGRATGDILFFTDVRQPLDRASLRHLVANFADQTVGVVTGDVRLVQGDGGEQADLNLYWRYELWARIRHSDILSSFNTAGCFYAMRRNLASPLPSDTISDDAILPLRAFFRGYRVILDPEAFVTDYPAIPGTESRRRFRNLAGLCQVFARVPELFTSRNRMRFHFLSHKFLRLVLPWAILAAVGSVLALPPSWFRNALIGSIAGVALLALIDWAVSDKFILKRLTSPARMFLAMNAASLAAPVVFFIPPHRIWVQTRVKAGDDSVDSPV